MWALFIIHRSLALCSSSKITHIRKVFVRKALCRSLLLAVCLNFYQKFSNNFHLHSSRSKENLKFRLQRVCRLLWRSRLLWRPARETFWRFIWYQKFFDGLLWVYLAEFIGLSWARTFYPVPILESEQSLFVVTQFTEFVSLPRTLECQEFLTLKSSERGAFSSKSLFVFTFKII